MRREGQKQEWTLLTVSNPSTLELDGRWSYWERTWLGSWGRIQQGVIEGSEDSIGDD